jgi:thiol-disulfide isomerase/thioredoxin
MSRRSGAAVLAACALAMALPAGCAPSHGGGGTSSGVAAPGTDVVAAGVSPAAPGAAADPYLDLVLMDPHGRRIRLADFKGKVRVFDLWATWCAPCREVIPQLNAIHERYRDKGLVVLGISVDDLPSEVLDFERRIPIRYPTGMFNPDVAALLGEPSVVPTTILIDRAGTLRKTFRGYVDARTLEQEILLLL